jgi:hypothetical protein
LIGGGRAGDERHDPLSGRGSSGRRGRSEDRIDAGIGIRPDRRVGGGRGVRRRRWIWWCRRRIGRGRGFGCRIGSRIRSGRRIGSRIRGRRRWLSAGRRFFRRSGLDRDCACRRHHREREKCDLQPDQQSTNTPSPPLDGLESKHRSKLPCPGQGPHDLRRTRCLRDDPPEISAVGHSAE